MTTRLLFVHALSPLHAGTGQGSGVIDLPIAREKATGIPYVPGSSIKGVLRDRAGDNADSIAIFGPNTENASEHAGSLQIADARLLLLPVRSLRGTFAWVTSPYVLRRFAREARDAGAKVMVKPDDGGLPKVPELLDDQQCIVPIGSALTMKIRNNDSIVLEDLDLTVRTDADMTAWADWIGTRVFNGEAEWQTMLKGRFCLVSDNLLTFLLNTALEVIARIRLQEDTKTVAKGALWYEEALPAETILSSLAVATPIKKVERTTAAIFDFLARQTNKAIQIGGKATVGRGVCRLRLSNEGA